MPHGFNSDSKNAASLKSPPQVTYDYLPPTPSDLCHFHAAYTTQWHSLQNPASALLTCCTGRLNKHILRVN